MIKVSQEFLEENKNIRQHRPKTAPYTKEQRRKRRDEVFKLHFEYGYSARTISEMMKINRHTINGDVTFWHSKIKLNVEKIDVNDWFGKQLYRLESQQTRLRKELDNTQSLDDRLSIEKMISDSESRINNLYWKVATAEDPIQRNVQKTLNSYLKKLGMNHRMVSNQELSRLPKEDYERIAKLIGRVKI